jgi:putative transposase
MLTSCTSRPTGRSSWEPGSTSDLNAAVESLIGPYKTELIRRRGPWRGLDDLELATLGYVDWFNHGRLHDACGDIPPAEHEDTYYRQIAGLTEDQPADQSLH